MQYRVSPEKTYIDYFVDKEDDINYLYNCYWMTRPEINESWFRSNPEFKSLETSDSTFVVAMPLVYKNPKDEKEDFIQKREMFRTLLREELKNEDSLVIVSDKENDRLIKNCSFEQIKKVITMTSFQDLRHSCHI